MSDVEKNIRAKSYWNADELKKLGDSNTAENAQFKKWNED